MKIPITTESINDDKKTIEFTMSTDDIDREGESVRQDWDLEAFKKNPVMLNAHQVGDATEAIGKVVEIEQNEHSLEGKVQFAVEQNEKAETIYELYKGGFLNAVSVGFRELESGVNELLELSSVTVPANAMATAKSKGLDLNGVATESKILSEARDPDYDGTETGDWGEVGKDMEDFLQQAPGDTEDVDSVEDMDSDTKSWIASKSLLGEAGADTWDDLMFFPVVNPNTNNLNKNALVAVRSGRGQAADIPESTYNSADAKAKQLLEDEFDVEYEEEAAEEEETTEGEEEETEEKEEDTETDTEEGTDKVLENALEKVKAAALELQDALKEKQAEDSDEETAEGSNEEATDEKDIKEVMETYNLTTDDLPVDLQEASASLVKKIGKAKQEDDSSDEETTESSNEETDKSEDEDEAMSKEEVKDALKEIHKNTKKRKKHKLIRELKDELEL